MSSHHPTATVSMLLFQRQKERKKLEKEEKIDDASQHVRECLYELMYCPCIQDYMNLSNYCYKHECYSSIYNFKLISEKFKCNN